MINQKLVDNIKDHGIYTDSPEERHKALADIGFRIGEKAEYAIITGCIQPQQMPNIFRGFKELLDRLKIDYTLLKKEYCCGWMPIGQPAVMTKNEEDIAKSRELSKELVRENFRQAEALGAKSIVLWCAACEPSYTNNAGETDLEIIPYGELIDRHFKGGRLTMDVDYYAGCYRFRRRITTEPVVLEAAARVLNKIEGLKVNYLDNNLCCYIQPHLEQLLPNIKSKTVVTICTGCYYSLLGKLQEKGECQVKLLPELVLEAVQGR